MDKQEEHQDALKELWRVRDRIHELVEKESSATDHVESRPRILDEMWDIVLEIDEYYWECKTTRSKEVARLARVARMEAYRKYKECL